MKKIYFLLLALLSLNILAQKTDKKEEGEENEDFKYETKHKNKPWFSEMKDGADYFAIKNKFDQYFGKHNWEQSKNRQIGEDWLKTKLFYLDKNGKVQPEPNIDRASILKNTTFTTSTTQIGDWTLLGPVNSARTGYSSNYNHGGYVYLNRIDPTNPQKMFASFITGGLWVTNDGGQNWTLTDSSYEDVKYNDIDVAISDPQTVYALSKNRLLKSVDGGLNWVSTNLNNTNYTGTAYDIAVSTSDSNLLIARWGTSIYRSTDGGTTWNAVQTGLSNCSIWDSSSHSEMMEWDSTDSNNVFAINQSNGTSLQIYKSTNQGQNFSQLVTITLDSSLTGQVIGWAKLFMPTSNTDSFYLAVGSGTTASNHLAAHLYKINKTTGNIELSRINMVTGIGDPYAHDPVLNHGDIQMDRTNENNIAYGSYGNQKIHISTDNGATFTVSNAMTHHDIRTLDFINNKLIVGSDGEMAVTTDNANTFTTLTNSISSHELWGFGSAFKTNIVAAGTNHGPVMVKETYNGFDWYNGTGADQGNTDVNPLDDRYIYSQGYSNYRYFRTGPHSLINESNSLDLGGIYSYFNSIEFHPNKYYTIITHHAGNRPAGNPNLATWKNSLIKTEDNGASISIVKTFTNQVFREKISAKNPKTMIVVEGLSNNKLWKTTDEGTTWTNITPSLAASSNQTNISDIAIGDEDPNQIWITYSGVQTVCKILKSNDGGVTWTNLTTNVLTSSPLSRIVFQRGSNGGVYVGNKAGVFYRNNAMPDWVMLGNGLPTCDVRFMFINYNENKLKIGTSRGAFMHDLYEISPPNALISVNSNKISCGAAEPLQFKDYSVVRNASATWNWSFPGGNPSTSTEENPIVSYANAPNGTYDVSLTVTDANGTSTQTLTNFIEVNNICGTTIPDKVPGNSVSLTGATNSDYINLNNFSLNKNSFTFSCWIKPNGIQEDYSAVFMSQGDANAFGLNFRGGNNGLGFHPNWSWNSGLVAPANQWSHIAIVSNGTNVKLYLNGKESVNNYAISSEVFAQLNLGRYGRGYTSRYTNLEMDEVAIWNRPLTIDEIRKWRHLTKSISGDPILTGLVYYLQFNESAGNITINKNNSTGYATYQGSGYTRNASAVPVFEGVSEKINVTSAGIKDFTTTGTTLEFANGTYPNGDIWVSKGTINPDQIPSGESNFGYYTIINNYGSNLTFSPLTSMSFYGNSAFEQDLNPNNYKLYKRNSNDFGATWGIALDNADSISGTGTSTKIKFDSGLNVTGFSQFFITNSGSTLSTASAFSQKIKYPKIIPNPSRQGEQISFFIPELWKNTYLKIYDLSGKKVAETRVLKNNDFIFLNLPKGVYVALFISDYLKHEQKIIIK